MKSQRELKELCAFTMVELLVLVACIALLGLTLLAQDMSPWARAQSTAQAAQCMTNLKLTGIAFRTWENDYGNKYPMAVSTNKGGTMEYGAGSQTFMSFQVMSNELNLPKTLVCPADDRKPVGSFAALSNDNLSYFVGLDADESRPAMLLDGDRNLVTNGVDVVPGLVVIGTGDTADWSAKMHNGIGNLGLADGSVQRTSPKGLQAFLDHTGTNLNRLAVP